MDYNLAKQSISDWVNNIQGIGYYEAPVTTNYLLKYRGRIAESILEQDVAKLSLTLGSTLGVLCFLSNLKEIPINPQLSSLEPLDQLDISFGIIGNEITKMYRPTRPKSEFATRDLKEGVDKAVGSLEMLSEKYHANISQGFSQYMIGLSHKKRF